MSSQVVRIRIELKYTKPPIWRRVDVPVSYSLYDLHQVIQAAFGWDDDHLHEFDFGNRTFSGSPRFAGLTGAFGGEGDGSDEVELRTVLGWGIKRFHYTYDFGDDWHHILTIMRVLEADPSTEYPALIAGMRGDPVEDVGGVWGLYDLADAASDPNHPRLKHFEEWLGTDFVDKFDLDRFDAEAVRGRLSYVAQSCGE